MGKRENPQFLSKNQFIKRRIVVCFCNSLLSYSSSHFFTPIPSFFNSSFPSFVLSFTYILPYWAPSPAINISPPYTFRPHSNSPADPSHIIINCWSCPIHKLLDLSLSLSKSTSPSYDFIPNSAREGKRKTSIHSPHFATTTQPWSRKFCSSTAPT